MRDMTLHEICDAFDVSRRAVQGYEKAGLVAPTGRNERSYLLYNEKAQERIKTIRMYQQMGFTIKEIAVIIDAPDDILKHALKAQIIKLTENRDKLEMTIRKMQTMIKELQ